MILATGSVDKNTQNLIIYKQSRTWNGSFDGPDLTLQGWNLMWFIKNQIRTIQCPSLPANKTSASQENQEIPPLPPWSSKVNCHIQNSPLPVPILSQIHAVHPYPFDCSKIHFNNILPFTPTVHNIWMYSVGRTWNLRMLTFWHRSFTFKF